MALGGVSLTPVRSSGAPSSDRPNSRRANVRSLVPPANAQDGPYRGSRGSQKGLTSGLVSPAAQISNAIDVLIECVSLGAACRCFCTLKAKNLNLAAFKGGLS